jgi:cell division protein FtsW
VSAAGFQPRLRSALALLDRPLTSYYLILGTSGLLLAVGLVMVLSTSSAAQLDRGSSPYAIFDKQLIGALTGLAIMLVLARVSPRLLRLVAYPVLLAAIAGLMLVLAFGATVNGAERWIQVGGVPVQPSEFAKLALLLWGADLLARKEQLGQLKNWRTLLIPLLPGATVLAMLVMLGDDLGTTFVLLVILLALLWVIGTPARLFACILGLILFALVLLVIVQPYRLQRVNQYWSPSGNPVGQNQQGIQGRWAIASGGLWGVGLGGSKEKWGWLPNATNDFIFAILGEELGLIGTVCVVLLYGGLGYAGLRVARRVADPFMRLAAAGATAWIVIQALVNICAVVGLLPITGVPLPLISAGLSSLLATMAAIGMLLCFARSEPGAKDALAVTATRWRRRLGAAAPTDQPVAQGGKSSPRAQVRPRRVRAGPESAGLKQPRPAPSRLADRDARPTQAGRNGRRRLPEDANARAQRQAAVNLEPQPPAGSQRPRPRTPGPQRPNPRLRPDRPQ